MLDEINGAIASYETAWELLVSGRSNQGFFKKLKPTAVAWKVEDIADFNKRFAQLRDLCDQVHLGWINERWLATLHLKNIVLVNGASVVKIMERRPGSNDPTGLDHVDFYIAGTDDIKQVLHNEPDLKWTEEKNGDYCRWISLWFDSTEAKLRRDTVLQPCIDELEAVQEKILDDIA